MLLKSGMGKEPFKVQGRPMDFNVAENEKLLIWFQVPYGN